MKNNPLYYILIPIYIWLMLCSMPAKSQKIDGSALRDTIEHLDNIGNYKRAAALTYTYLDILRKNFGDTTKQVARGNLSLAELLVTTGQYLKADSIYDHALKIAERSVGKKDTLYGKICLSKCSNLIRIGRLEEAEKYVELAKTNFINIYGESGFKLADIYGTIGYLANTLGNFVKAEKNFRRSLELHLLVNKDGDVGTGFAYNNLGMVYVNLFEYDKALESYQKATEIQLKLNGENHPNLAICYNNLANLYSDLGRLTAAEPYYHKCIEIQKKNLGENSMPLAASYLNLGLCYRDLGKTDMAEQYFLKCLNIRLKYLSEFHPDLGKLNRILGTLYNVKGNKAESEKYYLKLKHNFLGQIQYFFPGLSDSEKEILVGSLHKEIETFYSFCALRTESNPAITGEFYNTQLATKAVLLQSTAKWTKRIKNSQDKELLAEFEKWEKIQDKISSLYNRVDSTAGKKILELQEKSDVLEKSLSFKSESFASLTDQTVFSWKNVQAQLKPGEAAIELVRIKKFGIDTVLIDSSLESKPEYTIHGLSKTIQYAALIVRPGLTSPEMVLLENGNELEEKAIRQYTSCIKKHQPDLKSYQWFWQKIGRSLGKNTRKVFISPDGVFQAINFNTLYNPTTRKYLIDEMDIRIVTSTKDLLLKKSQNDSSRIARLIGFPKFYSSHSVASTNSIKEVANDTENRSIANLDVSLNELPATRLELEKISQILTSKNWVVETFSGNEATEEVLKNADHPRILHIASHGFFDVSTSSETNPLLQSGLYLAGSGSTLKGESTEKKEDGVLTALEAMNLNLENTDLVVLSACETGLGKVKNGEGVYGLQRAFIVAGAKSLIMSLWKVSDQATQELMVSFYKHWLIDPDSKPNLNKNSNRKRKAFLAAQKELKSKYPDPYFWGAFVMVGE